jgi:hypothetical protein
MELEMSLYRWAIVVRDQSGRPHFLGSGESALFKTKEEAELALARDNLPGRVVLVFLTITEVFPDKPVRPDEYTLLLPREHRLLAEGLRKQMENEYRKSGLSWEDFDKRADADLRATIRGLRDSGPLQ